MFLMEHWQSANAVALHDWLIYAWARDAGCTWFIDKRSMLSYRQHATNQMGANSGVLQMLRRFKLVRQGWYRGEVEKLLRCWRLGGHFNWRCAARCFKSLVSAEEYFSDSARCQGPPPPLGIAAFEYILMTCVSAFYSREALSKRVTQLFSSLNDSMKGREAV